jgi:membrane protein YdbS with pleckstrin-like domain
VTLDDIPMGPLAPAYRSVLRVGGAITAAMLIAVALAGEAVAWRQGLPPGLLVGPVLLWSIWWVAVGAPRRWARWRFAFTGRELHVASGWLTRVHTAVPVRRVQHIDLTQGPVERRYGLATLVLHTAGTMHSRVAVPGLEREEAERIRDAIRGSVELTDR